MSMFLNPRGRPTFGIGLCDRCKFKHFLDDLKPDRDKPGMRVCDDCNDKISPYKLPPRRPDDETLMYPRPETPLELAVPPEETPAEEFVYSLDFSDVRNSMYFGIAVGVGVA